MRGGATSPAALFRCSAAEITRSSLSNGWIAERKKAILDSFDRRDLAGARALAEGAGLDLAQLGLVMRNLSPATVIAVVALSVVQVSVLVVVSVWVKTTLAGSIGCMLKRSR